MKIGIKLKNHIGHPISAKHFAFRIETTDLHNLLNSEYSLVDDKGNLLQFNQGEDKITCIEFYYPNNLIC